MTEEQNVECLLLKQKWKDISNRFEQWFKRKTWLEEQMLVYTIWSDDATILNMPESAEIYKNMGNFKNIPR